MTTAPLPARLMIGISVLQGLVLLALYRAFELDFWPSESPLWSFPLWTLAVAMPILFLLSLESVNKRRLGVHLLIAGLVLALLATYTGSQALPFGEFPVISLGWVYTLAITVACFKALMYLQLRAAGQPMSYPLLFSASWRNFLVLALSSLFVFIFWLILMLWAQLFKVIGIHFFHSLFKQDWFLFPALSVALGIGIMLFRNLIQIIDSITNLLRGLIKYLLPVVIGVCVLFLAALPFTGLSALWSTGSGTALLMWLMGAILFFVNAVYQDGRGDFPYSELLHRFIYLSLLTLPLLSALSLYGLWLRVEQHGLSVARCWALLVWFLLSAFVIGYAVGIVRRKDQWPQALANVNRFMGLIVLASAVLATSPLLDFRKLSAASQLQRVASGELEVLDFDFWYARNRLGRAGYLAVNQLKSDYADNPRLVARIENATRYGDIGRARSSDAFWEQVSYRPEPFDPPDSLITLIDGQHRPADATSVLFRVDLDADEQWEYVLLSYQNERVVAAILYHQSDGAWQVRYLNWHKASDVDSLVEDIREGEISLVDARFKNLKVGELIFETR